MKIVSREQWGAAAPKSIPKFAPWSKANDLWVHHTAGPTGQSVKSIQSFHQGPSRNWNDIGYHYLVNEAGTVFEGRGREVWGAHSPGKNHEPSVALIGDYSTRVPTDAQHRAVYALRDFLGVNRVRGHRENTATTCPGEAAYQKIVRGGPPKAPAKPKLTLLERLKKAGFGGKSARQIIAKLGGRK